MANQPDSLQAELEQKFPQAAAPRAGQDGKLDLQRELQAKFPITSDVNGGAEPPASSTPPAPSFLDEVGSGIRDFVSKALGASGQAAENESEGQQAALPTVENAAKTAAMLGAPLPSAATELSSVPTEYGPFEPYVSKAKQSVTAKMLVGTSQEPTAGGASLYNSLPPLPSTGQAESGLAVVGPNGQVVMPSQQPGEQPAPTQDIRDLPVVRLEGAIPDDLAQEYPKRAAVVDTAARAISSATTPENLATVLGFAVTPGEGAIGLAKRLVSLGWAGEQASDAVTDITSALQARKDGDDVGATRNWTSAAINGVLSLAGATYGATGEAGAGEVLPEAQAASQMEGLGAEDLLEAPSRPQQAQPTQPVAATRQSSAPSLAQELAEKFPTGQTAPPQIVGPAQEPLAAESPETLQAQTDALANGTNPVVYIPQETPADDIPDLPDNALATEVEGNRPGAGLYYHTPDIAPEDIQSAVDSGDFGKLLGFAQPKAEALAGTQPSVLVARDENGTELKAAAVDGGDPDAVAAQTDTLRQQFPDAASIALEHPAETIGARASGRRGEAGFVSGEMLRDIASGKIGREAGQKITDDILRLGDKYNTIRKADPELADQLQTLDNSGTYYRAKAEANLQKVTGGLSRSQERLAALMSDADARENLRLNHPDEYEQAVNDPDVMRSVAAYKPLADELTRLRKSRGGQVLGRDYLRRVYDEHVAGIGDAKGIGAPEAGAQFDRVIRPSKPTTAGREASAEYFHEHGLHEFGPAYGAKYMAERIATLRDSIARRFMAKATKISSDAELPREISYNGRKFYRPDVAAEMKRGTPRYAAYDPNRGIRTALVDRETGDVAFGRSAYKYLGPREIVDALSDYDANNRLGPEGSIRNFFRQQIVGLGFGIPHVLNIERRVMQNFHGGALNPKAWVGAFKVALSKTLKERAINGVDDPRFDTLLKNGGMSAGEVKNYRRYIGGNLNPANWAAVGHKIIFGKGGFDARARLYVADLMKSQHPEISDPELARAINRSLGDYNRANWTDVQKALSHVLMFPGWDTSSFRWILQHPIRTTVPPAVLVLIANRASHYLGGNQGQDATDIGAVHVGNRAYSTGLLNESLARALYRPALNFAQAKIRGESNARAMAGAGRGVRSAAQGVVAKTMPPIQAAASLAANRQGVYSSKEIVGRGQNTGKNLAKLAAKTAFPVADRLFDLNEIDVPGFIGGNLGVSNYRSDAASRLSRNAAQAATTYSTFAQLRKTDPEEAQRFLDDPDNHAELVFHKNLAELSTALQKNAAAAARASKIANKGLRARKLAELNERRGQILAIADAHDVALEKLRQKYHAAQSGVPRVPGISAPKAPADTGIPAPTFQ